MIGKLIRKLCAVTLSALMLTGTAAAVTSPYTGMTVRAAYTGTYRGFSYESDYSGNVTITGYEGSEQDVVIPAEIYGDPVVTVGPSAFESCETIRTLTVSEGIESIGDVAFGYCSNLESVTLPQESLISIGNSAFSGCETLESISIPDSVTELQDAAFKDCTSLKNVRLTSGIYYLRKMMFMGCTSLTHIDIPSGVNRIWESAFEGSGLTSVSLPDSLERIDKNVFRYCTGLEQIYIPASVKEIYTGVFTGCTSLTAINTAPDNPVFYSQDGVLFTDNKQTLKICPQGKAGAFTVPGFVWGINNDAFRNCVSITSVTISDGVKEIYTGAFMNCSSLNTITIPASVTTINSDVFKGCPRLTIIAPKGSTAAAYAQDNNIPFEELRDELKNDSSLSGGSVVLGRSINVNCAASDGYPDYQYEVSIRDAGSGSFRTVQSYSANSTVSITPGSAGTCTVRVNVKDSKGTVKTRELALEVIDRLVNTSSASSASGVVGSSVTVSASATGGKGTIEFAYYRKGPDDSSWQLFKDFSVSTGASVTMDKTGEWRIMVRARDESGQSAGKEFAFTAYDALSPASALSPDKIQLGGRATVYCGSKGGTGEKQYMAEISKNGSDSFTTLRYYSSDTSIDVTPDSAGTFEIRVTVKDGSGATASQSLCLTVYSPLINTSTLSAQNTAANSSVTVNCTSTGGYGSILYAVYYTKPGSTSLFLQQNFSAADTVSFVPTETGTYTIRVKAKDSANNIMYNDLPLSVYAPLQNRSSLSAANIPVNGKINIVCSSTGGYGSKLYAIYYKKPGSSSWTKKQSYSGNTSSSFTPRSTGTYTIRVKAKDSAGTVKNKDMKLSVYAVLKNTSALSADHVLTKRSITISCSSTGGYGSKLYAVYYKKPGSSSWTKKQSYSDNTSVNFAPHSTGIYTIRVKAKDSAGTVKNRDMKLEVFASLKNTSTLSPESIKLGSSTKVTCSSTGGYGTRQYEVWYKPSSGSKWTKAKAYSAETSAFITPRKTGTYDISVKVMDERGVVAKKALTITVSK